MASARSVPTSECEDRLRLILVGKTGVGKSSFGNVLLERKDITMEEEKNASQDGFAVNHGMDSGTKRICSKSGHNSLLGRSFEIIDTPGLYDTNSEELLTTLENFTKLLSLSVPGPHAILFLVRCDVKFTKEEEETFYKIKEMFDDEVLKHMVIVFTHSDQLKISKDTLINRVPESLKKILGLVGNNYTLMSKTEDNDTRKKELSDVLSNIDKVSCRGTKYYSTELLEKIYKIIADEVKVRMITLKISYPEALKMIIEEINTDKWDLRFKLKLLYIVLISQAFALLIGLAAVSILSLPFIGISALGFSTMAGLVGVLTLIRSKTSGNRSKCTIS